LFGCARHGADLAMDIGCKRGRVVRDVRPGNVCRPLCMVVRKNLHN